MIPVPRLWDGETAVILAGGPSLTKDDVESVRGRARVLAIKDAVRLAPWADALYACDRKWWKRWGASLRFEGLKYSLEYPQAPLAGVLANTGVTGLELDPSGVRTGKNSGYQAINLAVHLGAHRLVLLGYDMQPALDGRHHWFGAHPYSTNDPPYWAFLDIWPSIVAPLLAAGIEVINATRRTALPCFKCLPLDEALS